MTADETRQMRSSVVAIILCILFLWSGKKFIWNTPEKPAPDTESSVTDHVAEHTTTTTTTTTAPPPQTDTTAAQEQTAPPDGTDTVTQTTEHTSTTVTETTTVTTAATVPVQNGFVPAPEGYFSDALFVGDSRTVGLANYAPIEGAEYFATVGLATHKLDNEKSEVGNYTNITFWTLLASKQYGKIYLMLGINEIGNNRSLTLQKYQEIVQKIRKAQPNAILYIEANLHVAQSRSSTDPVINNPQINSFNEAIAQLADNDHIFYLDVNPVFDDQDGALGAEYTRDGTHPYAKYYKNWDEFLLSNVIVK